MVRVYIYNMYNWYYHCTLRPPQGLKPPTYSSPCHPPAYHTHTPTHTPARHKHKPNHKTQNKYSESGNSKNITVQIITVFLANKSHHLPACPTKPDQSSFIKRKKKYATPVPLKKRKRKKKKTRKNKDASYAVCNATAQPTHEQK